MKRIIDCIAVVAIVLVSVISLCRVASGQDEKTDRLERLRQIQGDAPQAIASNSDQQILLNEATAIIEETEVLQQRKSQFPGDIEGIRQALSALRELLKQPAPSPLQARAANLTEKEREIREERQQMLSELQSVMSTLMGGAASSGNCETCGPNCPCGPGCVCINGECVQVANIPRPPMVQQTIPSVRAACATTGKPYAHDGCNCAFCRARPMPRAFMGGVSGQVATPSAGVRWEVVPGSCNSASGCQWRQVR